MRDLDVKEIRLKIGLSQDKFGLLLGVSRGSVAKWESQETKPAMDNAFKMLEIDSRFNSGEKNLVQNLLQEVKLIEKIKHPEKQNKRSLDHEKYIKLDKTFKRQWNIIDNKLQMIADEKGIRFPNAEFSRNLGFSKGVVSEYLNNKKRVSENFIQCLENFYGINYREFLNANNPVEEIKKKEIREEFKDLKIDDKLNVIYKMLSNTLDKIERIEKTNN